MTKVKSNLVILFGILFCIASVHVRTFAVKTQSCVITLPSDTRVIAEKIESCIKKPFFLGRITYHSDTNFSEEEFKYLVDIKEGTLIDSRDIKRVVSYLIKKNKFEKIDITLSSAGEGKWLHMELTGFWNFKDIKISGFFLLDKERYKKYYMLKSGDPFDKEKHEHSIVKLINILKDEGYFDVKVAPCLSYDDNTKSVSVNLNLQRGVRFSIGNVVFSAKKNGPVEDSMATLGKEMESFFSGRLTRNYYSKEMINKEARSVKKYLLNKGFLHVDIHLIEKVDRVKNKVDLVFTVEVYSKKEFIFFGNKFFSDERLLEKILLFGRSAWLVPASILSEDIFQAYYEKGYWHALIDSVEEPTGYYFIIQEGDRIAVKDIKFNSAKNFPSQILRTCFSEFLRSRFFDAQLLKKSINKLMHYYLKNGFLDIQILKQEFMKIDDSHYRLVLTIDEGEKKYLTSIILQGAEELRSQGPFENFQQNNLRIAFDAELLQNQKQWLIDYFQSKGYLYVEVNAELQKDGNNIVLIWKINKGDSVVTFGKTIMIGCSNFPFPYIARELNYREGELWDKEKLKKSLLRLRNLNIFEQVHLYPYQVSQYESQKDILLKLTPDDPFEFRLRAGIGLQEVNRHFIWRRGFTYKLGASFLYKNPFNLGDVFFAGMDFARSHRNICFTYSRPWIFNIPLSSIYKFYANRYDQPGFSGSKDKLYQVKQEGFLVGLERIFSKFHLSTNIGVEWMQTKINDNMSAVANRIAEAINFESRLLGEKLPYLLFEPTVLIDCLDNKINPTIGSFTLLTLKGMFPLSSKYSDLFFVRVLAEQSFFYPIANCLIAALRLRIGHVFYQVFKNIMPIERFYLGGANSVRSYEADLCPPVGFFKDKSDCYRIAPQGGKTMANGNFELRFPLFKALGGVVFQDLGALVGDRLDKSSLFAATGFGLRINTPIGPIRFDIGWKWNPCRQFESSYTWVLVFGNAF